MLFWLKPLSVVNLGSKVFTHNPPPFVTAAQPVTQAQSRAYCIQNLSVNCCQYAVRTLIQPTDNYTQT